ncbi:MAG: single-stranded DNA-binding protein [Candidatus Altiarchaeales archaeon]|nr:single-stranded DNA-binding protein [Candidatus Altiarchaeales archaeon]
MSRNIDMKVEELRPKIKRIKIIFKVLETLETKQVVSRQDRTKHNVADVLVADDTGSIILTLWDEDIEQFSEGEVYEVSDAYTSIFKGMLRLNIGRYSSVKRLEEPVEVNLENNVSEEVHKQYLNRRRRHGFGSGSFWP